MHTPAKVMKGMVIVKLHKSVKEPEIYYYFNTKNENCGCIVTSIMTTQEKKREEKSGFKSEKEALKSLLEVKVTTLRGESKKLNMIN